MLKAHKRLISGDRKRENFSVCDSHHRAAAEERREAEEDAGEEGS